MSCREPKGRNRKNPRIFQRATLLVDELAENESSGRESVELFDGTNFLPKNTEYWFYWMTYRGPGFLAVVVYLYQSSCVCHRSSLPTGWGGGGRVWRRRESLVLYKSFTTLWLRERTMWLPMARALLLWKYGAAATTAGMYMNPNPRPLITL